MLFSENSSPKHLQYITFLCVALSVLLGARSGQAAQVMLLTSADPPHGGTITGAGPYASGQNVNVTIAAAPGWYVSNVAANPAPGTQLNYTREKIILILNGGDTTSITNDTENFAISAHTVLTASFQFKGLNPASPIEVITDGIRATNSFVASDPVTVTLQSTYTNALILYTLDGTAPNFGSLQYSGPFSVNAAATLRALAFNSDFSQSSTSAPVSITFVPKYPLAVSNPGGGTVTLVPSGGSYASNTTVSLLAKPDSGWSLMGWDGTHGETGVVQSVTMNGPRTVSATFGTSLNTTGSGGTILKHPVASLHPYGSTVKMTAIPNPGNYFALWGNAGSGTANPRYHVVTTANPTVSALFPPLENNDVALTVQTEGGGTVAVFPQANKFALGSTNSVTATPAAGQRFLGWSGDASGTNNPLTLLMDGSKTITAHFTKTPSLQLSVLSESELALTVSGIEGYLFRIESSTNLLLWETLVSKTNFLGTERLRNAFSITEPLRMYRAVVP